MNLSLQDPLVITADYPSTLTTSLAYGQSACVSISQCGHYIASGLIDGLVIVVDTWTHNVSAVLRGHSKSVVGIKWIDDGRGGVGLVSWANDWQVIVWDLVKGKFEISRQFRFTGGVVDACWVVRDGLLCVIVARVTGELVVVTAKDDSRLVVQNPEGKGDGVGQCLRPVCGGRYVVVGTSKGWLNILDTTVWEVVRALKVCSSSIKGIDIVEQAHFVNGEVQYGSEVCSMSKMLINSSDKILRQCNISGWEVENENWELIVEHKYQDVVNQVQWNRIRLGPSAEYICASAKSHGGSSHEIYVWETSMGSLVQILEGSQEELYDIDWCGRKCEIVATGFDTGTIYLWGLQIEPKWSALAPDFEEIEQNIDYEEAEDEFDFLGGVEDSDEKEEELQRAAVDVFTRERKDARGFTIVKNVKVDVDFV